MALNLPLMNQETLVPPIFIQKNENNHGAQGAISNYSKRKIDSNLRVQIDERFTPSLARQHGSKQKRYEDKHREQQLQTELQGNLFPRGQQQHFQQQPQRNQRHAPNIRKFLLDPSSFLDGKSMEDILGDDSKEVIPDDVLKSISFLRDENVGPTAEASTHRRRVHQPPRTTRPPSSGFNFQITPRERTALKEGHFRPSIPSLHWNGPALPTTYRPQRNPTSANPTSANPPSPRQKITPRQPSDKPKVSLRSVTQVPFKDKTQDKTFPVREIPFKSRTPKGLKNEPRHKEELADFSNLFHHEKTFHELSKGNKDVEVTEGWLFTGEGKQRIFNVCYLSKYLTSNKIKF